MIILDDYVKYVQVYQVTKQLAQFTTVEVALSVGGLDLKMQEAMLRYNLAYLQRDIECMSWSISCEDPDPGICGQLYADPVLGPTINQ